MSVRAHGTRAKYVVDQCRCGPCRRANTRDQRARARRKLYASHGGAEPLLVDAEPARRHVRSVMDAGVGRRRIVALSGVSGSTLTKLLYGGPAGRPPVRRIRPVTEQRLLAVGVDPAAGARVDATGCRRRLQALIARGWSQSRLAALLGQTPSNFGVTLRSDQVYVSTQRAVRELYDRVWDQAPPENTHRERQAASRARNYARDRCWAPPLAWDDDTIDRPDATPATGGDEGGDVVDPIAVERACSGHPAATLRRADRIAAAGQLADRGMTASVIAKRLRMSHTTVQKILSTRHGKELTHA